MSATLVVRWGGQERRYTPDQVVTIGRDDSCVLSIDNPNVSRRHAELRHDGAGWRVRDVGSSQGTFVDGAPAQDAAVVAGSVVTLGRPSVGTTLRLDVVDAADAVPGTLLPPPGAAQLPATVLPESPARPGGNLRADQLGGATVVTGAGINVECGGRSYQFEPGREVVLGRDAGAEVTSTNPTVSRRHAALRHDGTGWRIDDLGSAGGTWIDGRRTTTLPLAGSTAAWLGDPETGERVVLVTAGTRQLSTTQRLERTARRRSPLLLAGVAVLALVAVLAGGLALVSRDGDPAAAGPPSNDELLRSAVAILALPASAGSGSVIDAEEGLILTNAHVVAPRALGMAQLAYGGDDTEDSLPLEPSTILVGLADEAGAATEVQFEAEVVAVDGYLDLAVIRITRKASGAFLDDDDLDDLHEIELGDSDDLRTGEDIRVVGFPGIERSRAASLARGVVSSDISDDRLKVNRGWINVDANVDPGNSGGLAVDAQGRLVGVPTAGSFDPDSGAKANRLRPVNLAKPLLEAARAGTPYESPHLTPLTGDEDVTLEMVVPTSYGGFGATCDGSARPAAAGDTFAALALTYQGFTEGAHQDVRIDIVDVASRTLLGRADTAEEFPFTFSEDGCASVTILLDEPIVDPAGTRAVVYVGANRKLLAAFVLGA